MPPQRFANLLMPFTKRLELTQCSSPRSNWQTKRYNKVANNSGRWPLKFEEIAGLQRQASTILRRCKFVFSDVCDCLGLSSDGKFDETPTWVPGIKVDPLAWQHTTPSCSKGPVAGSDQVSYLTKSWRQSSKFQRPISQTILQSD